MDIPSTTPVGVRNMADLVRRAAAVSPDKAAFRFRDEVVTWAEVDARVDAVATGLRARGLTVGDRVALLLANTPDYVAAYFGILRAGCVAVPINTSYTADELTYLLNDSGTRMALCGRAAAPVVSGLLPDVPSLGTVLVTDTAPLSGTATFDELLRPGERVEPLTGGENLAVVMYTSGTSGRPKGAMLSHRALIGNLEQTARIEPKAIDADDIVLLVLPLFHIYGLNGGLGEVAYHGATGVLVERFDPVETLAEIRRHGVTAVMGAPPMFVAWSMLPDVGEAFQTVRLAISGSAPLPPAVHRTMLESTGHHVFEGYGLTETAPVLTTTLTSEAPKPGSIGRPIPGVELRLLDDSRSEVDEDDPGEIVVRGANLFSGYWPDGREGPDADGWLGTGDVAYADEDGDLFLVDRMRELILVSGFNVYPREVEDVLIKHPDIAEVAVIAMPHPYTGESVKALVRLADGARLSAEDVIEYAALSLARFKCPTTVRFLSSFPHTATGRVAKGQLREAEAAGVGG
ncbi:MAG: AMP-binding protein [Frankiaceae bacterium]